MFRFISPESAVWLDAAGSAQARPADADRAARVLRQDYERWSRLALGVLAFIMTAGALAVGAAAWSFLLTPPLEAATVITAIIAPLVAIVGCVGLWMLHRSGRRLAKAAAWWMRLPYRAGIRTRGTRGYVLARTVYLEPPLLARSLTMGCALLLLIIGASGCIYSIASGQDASVPLALGLLAVVSVVCFLGQLGGVARIGAGASEADPLWVRIRDSFRAG